MDTWSLVGLLAFSLIAASVTRWLATRIEQRAATVGSPFIPIVADLSWTLVIFLGGVIAARYIERTSKPIIGYLVFGLVSTFLSLIRAFLYGRTEHWRKPGQRLDTQWLMRNATSTWNYLLWSATVYLVLCLVTKRPADPVLFIPALLGALLPAVDSHDTIPGRICAPISRQLERLAGHRQAWHSLGANVFVALVTAPLIPIAGWCAWLLISIGYLSHLLLDTLLPEGIMLFWPLSRTRYSAFGSFIRSKESTAEHRIAIALAIVVVVLLSLVDVHRPLPQTAANPSFESSLERYLSLRGRNLAFADVDGTWNVTGRRISARFEILGAADQSLVLLDRFGGKVFTAGRTNTDNLYLNSINVVAGTAVRVKPVEIELRNAQLKDALPILYQMQSEPGLQHIFVSGEIVTPPTHESFIPPLEVDYAQTQLQKVRELGMGHYDLRYLMAGELIEMSNVSVDIANLVIVATYASPATGPTATPLPSPSPISEVAP